MLDQVVLTSQCPCVATGKKNYVNFIYCSNKKCFQNDIDANNKVKATHDLLICITGISGNEILIKLYKACTSTK